VPSQEKFRQKVLSRIREKYSGTEQSRFGPTLAAEHLAEEDGLSVDGETLRRWMLTEGCGVAVGGGKRTASGRSGRALGEQETIWAAVGVLRRWISKYGHRRTPGPSAGRNFLSSHSGRTHRSNSTFLIAKRSLINDKQQMSWHCRAEPIVSKLKEPPCLPVPRAVRSLT
jgi:hypothetical protein